MALGRHHSAALVGLSWAVPLLLAGSSRSSYSRQDTPGSPMSATGQADVAKGPGTPDPVYLIIRSDDAGFSHSVNMALQRLIDTGLPLSVSVMFACPWYQETVELLKRHPAVAVGIHLTLNSEWKNYRWGPGSGRGAVPTLVDSKGDFFQSAEELHHNTPAVG